MTVLNKRQPIYDFNDYLLNGTDVGTLLGWPNPQGIRPIIPTQQQPEPNANVDDQPYIVYSFRTIHDPDMWWLHTDEVSYVIWGRSFDKLSEVANEIMDNARAMDDSAGDLMGYLISRGTEIEWKFHWVRVMASYSPEPASQEGGRLGWIITLRYEYSPLSGKHVG